MTINELIRKLENIRDKGGAGGDAPVEGIVLDPIMVRRGCKVQPFLDNGTAKLNIYTPNALEALTPAAIEWAKGENND